MADLQKIYSKALEAHEDGEYEQAVFLYGQILDQHSDADLVIYNQGLALYGLDRFPEAVAAFSQVAEIRQDDADSWFNLGLALKQCGLFAEAEEAYLTALELQPDEPDFLYNLACCFRDNNDLDQAVALYKQVLELTEDVSALDNLAFLMHKQGDFPQAKKYYTRLQELRPDHPTAGYMLAALQGENVAAPPQEYVRELFDQYSDTFDASLTEKLGYQTPQLLKARFDQLVESNQPVKEKFSRCLDLGCGTGLAGGAFRSVCSHLVGVDLSEQMIEQARQKQIYNRLEAGDILEFLKTAHSRKQQYDLIIAADVLTYLGELASLFREAAGAATAEGLFVFSTEKISFSSEKIDPPGWTLQTSGRFAHHRPYIQATAELSGWRLIFVETVQLRREGAGWIQGDIFFMGQR